MEQGKKKQSVKLSFDFGENGVPFSDAFELFDLLGLGGAVDEMKELFPFSKNPELTEAE